MGPSVWCWTLDTGIVDSIISRILLSAFTGFTGVTCESDLVGCPKQCGQNGYCVDLANGFRYGKFKTEKNVKKKCTRLIYGDACNEC